MPFFRRITTLTLLSFTSMLPLMAGAADDRADDAKQKVVKALDFEMKSLAGKKVELSKYRGKVVLMVNVASECGLTPQYKQLQALHDKYASEGLAILGFPCNQFGKQEPGTSQEIAQFCSVNYGVKFDMFEKVAVNGQDACPTVQTLNKLESQAEGKRQSQLEL